MNYYQFLNLSYNFDGRFVKVGCVLDVGKFSDMENMCCKLYLEMIVFYVL